MIKLSKSQILKMHLMLVEKTGGEAGLRDEGLLESAIYSIDASFDGEDLYPSILEKAAKLCFSLVNNHAFIDGNKRIGIFAMLVFLESNNIFLSYEQQALVDLGLGLADGKVSQKELLKWINEHI